MKRFQVEQTQKSIEIEKTLVDVSSCVAVGGGAI